MSEFVKWTDENLVGKPQIDGLREHLFHLGSQALLMLQSQSSDVRKAHEVLNNIVEAMRACFTAEEKMLASNACPFLQEHVSEHDGFMERLMTLILNSQVRTIDQNELHAVMHEWASKHARTVDLKCKDCGYTTFHTPSHAETFCVHRCT